MNRPHERRTRRALCERTAKYSYLFTYDPDAAQPDAVYSYYGVARTYFDLPMPEHTAGDFFVMTCFGLILHYQNGALVEQRNFEAEQDSRFVWHIPV